MGPALPPRWPLIIPCVLLPHRLPHRLPPPGLKHGELSPLSLAERVRGGHGADRPAVATPLAFGMDGGDPFDEAEMLGAGFWDSVFEPAELFLQVALWGGTVWGTLCGFTVWVHRRSFSSHCLSLSSRLKTCV